MKARMTPLTVVLSLMAATAYAADPNLGTWKLDESKSKFPADSSKLTTVVYEQVGDSIKITVDGVTKDGKPLHNEWTGKIDGKDYPVVGSADADARSVKKVDDHHYTVVNKKAGKSTIVTKVALAKDFKSRTVTYSGTTADGKPVTGSFFYDKQ